jgi:hypothetical protein
MGGEIFSGKKSEFIKTPFNKGFFTIQPPSDTLDTEKIY